MHTSIDRSAIGIVLWWVIEFDESTGGYFISEQDGPQYGHDKKWGPMPFNLVKTYIKERLSDIDLEQLCQRLHQCRRF